MSTSTRLNNAAHRLATLPNSILYILLFAAVTLTHLTLLHLPYFWDEGGYYIPAALDFYHYHTLIPQFTNAHPPLPNVVLGTLWRIFGYHILVTRLAICACAAAAVLAVFRLTQRLLTPAAAIAVTFLTAAYPIWFAQSTLAHADIFAAAFTLWAFALYLPAQNQLSQKPTHNLSSRSNRSEVDRPAAKTRRHQIAVATLFSLAVLAKETAIIQPATLAAIHLFLLIARKENRRANATWLAALSFPLLPLLTWYAYHHLHTGFTFGNPEYLRYNATANLTAAHIYQAIYYRFLHLFWQRNIWLPILLAAACLLLPSRKRLLTIHHSLLTAALLIAANWLAFSILGGALLTRYLLPVYPLILILCVAIWRDRTTYWPFFTALTAAAFITAIWINPPTSFAPEDNLTYRDMIVVHQQAAAYIEQHYPDARVLTAWPAAAELFRPDLGYVSHSIPISPIENFTTPEINKAIQKPGDFDTALVFTTHYTSPALRRYFDHHPNSSRSREYEKNRDLTPHEIAAMLHGTVVANYERNGEWAAVIRFNRSYEALLTP